VVLPCCDGRTSVYLPHLESIADSLFFLSFVTAFASWVHDFQPTLSYFGVQIAVAFYLIHLNSIRNRAFASVARDRVVGILLGLIMKCSSSINMGASAVSDEEGVPFGGSIAGSICTRADLEGLQSGRGTQLLPA